MDSNVKLKFPKLRYYELLLPSEENGKEKKITSYIICETSFRFD